MPTDYMPTGLDRLAPWFTNFAAKFSQDASGLGFTPADATTLSNDAAMVVNLQTSLESYKAASSERIAYFRVLFTKPIGTPAPTPPQTPSPPPPAIVVLPGIQARTRLLVNRIKLSSGYSESVGRDFRIIAPPPPAPNPNAKPTISAQFVGGVVQIKFTKGVYDGVTVETQATGSTEWVVLDKFAVSPGVDARPATASTSVRKYRAMYYKRNDDAGQWSETATVALVF